MCGCVLHSASVCAAGYKVLKHRLKWLYGTKNYLPRKSFYIEHEARQAAREEWHGKYAPTSAALQDFMSPNTMPPSTAAPNLNQLAAQAAIEAAAIAAGETSEEEEEEE